jgi:acetyl-CoA/propionyl-CoA carboxylase biotin carboxyl carrier protein
VLDYTVEVSGKRFDVKILAAPTGAAQNNGSGPARTKRTQRERTKSGPSGDVLASPMQGTVLRIAVAAGAEVAEGALIAIVEAMKMENEITAHKSGTVSELTISVGDAVGAGDTVAVIISAP